jgi:hypothetical protein
MNAVLLTLAVLAHPTVTPTAIIGSHGGDPTPRFSAHYTNVLIVPAGQTVTLPADSTYDAVEVSGTLLASQDHDTVCRTIHLTVMPGGVLDLDTPKRCEIVFRDVPLRTGTVQQPDIDPAQIGNGLLVFGTLRVHGKPLARTWTQLGAEALAGATTIQFAVPGGWQVGDEILIPDSRQIVSTGQSLVPIRRESPARIAAINGDVVTLDKPLDFEHLAARTPDGAVWAMPHVLNLTRNVVLRSENPQGVKGHVIFMEQAEVDAAYFEVRDMGRTRAEPLHSTSLTGSATDQIGTNQIARYAWHWHHVHGHASVDGFTGRTVGAVFRGGEKWGCVQHGTHDLLLSDNIALDQIGSGFVTEDGYEVRGHYLRNFAAYIRGNGKDGKGSFGANIPGGEGAGFWFHGPRQTIQGNCAACCASGFVPFYRGQVRDRLIPGIPGGMADTAFNPTSAVPISFSDNEAYSCKSFGYEMWNNPVQEPKLLIVNFKAWHNGLWQVKAGTDEPGSITATNLRCLVDGGRANGVSTSAAYNSLLEIDGGAILGCSVGVREAKRVVAITNLEMQNVVNVDFGAFRPERAVIDGLLCKPFAGKPLVALKLGTGFTWAIGQQLPKFPTSDVTTWDPSDGRRYVVKNWQRQGQDYLLFERQSLASRDALPAMGYSARWCPEAGLTNQECWDKYGVAFSGGIIKDSDAIELPGLVNGVAKPGLDYYPLPVARAVLQQPNMLEPFNPASTDRLYLTITGQPAGDTMVSIDGGTPARRRPDANDPPGFLRVARSTVPGTHTITTWRLDVGGNEIAGSRLENRYFVGDPSDPEEPPPPPPPPPPLTLEQRVERLEKAVFGP